MNPPTILPPYPCIPEYSLLFSSVTYSTHLPITIPCPKYTFKLQIIGLKYSERERLDRNVDESLEAPYLDSGISHDTLPPWFQWVGFNNNALSCSNDMRTPYCLWVY